MADKNDATRPNNHYFGFSHLWRVLQEEDEGEDLGQNLLCIYLSVRKLKSKLGKRKGITVSASLLPICLNKT